ncbi:MAG TPA: 16S rRNA (guanine(966)-N(2))-methyltransferase RsmD [Solibacterales bacterium]|nr:16S rRNA (guanine(966)-N(2))-methyltransferase RsmD [Bryobacterales bacterium]
MRVIAGELRSRLLKSLPGTEVRPTPDRLREALFSILTPEIEGATFLDAYAGTGAVGIEALSRGAAYAVFVESNAAAARVIEENLMALGLTRRAMVVKGTVSQTLGRQRADIAFLDPPFTREQEYQLALEILAKHPPRLVIAQHSKHFVLAERFAPLRRTRMLRQGDNALSFFRPEEAKAETNPDRELFAVSVEDAGDLE